jgi:hypothetical protein
LHNDLHFQRMPCIIIIIKLPDQAIASSSSACHAVPAAVPRAQDADPICMMLFARHPVSAAVLKVSATGQWPFLPTS